MTSGGYDLGAGRGRGVGCVSLGKVSGEGEGDRRVKGLRSEDRICVVRDAGESVGRLARWEFV